MAKTPNKSTPGLINAPSRATGTSPFPPSTPEQRARLDQIRRDRLVALGAQQVNPLEEEERAQVSPFDPDKEDISRAFSEPLHIKFSGAAREERRTILPAEETHPILSPEALKKPDIKTLVAQALDTNIVVAVGNPVQAVTAKRGLEAAGRTVMVLNNFAAPVPEDEKQRVAQRFKDAEAGTAALIVVSEMTPAAQMILDKHPEIRDDVEKSATDLDM